MGPHGGRRTTSATMIDRCEKSHLAEYLFSCSYSSYCTFTTATHHAAMMYQIGGREEATNLAWRLPRQRLRCRPLWLEGGFSLANLSGKNMLTTTQQHLSTRRDLNSQHQLPWCPTRGAATYNSQPAGWMIVVCGGAGNGAPWRPWDDGGGHGRWGSV